MTEQWTIELTETHKEGFAPTLSLVAFFQQQEHGNFVVLVDLRDVYICECVQRYMDVNGKYMSLRTTIFEYQHEKTRRVMTTRPDEPASLMLKLLDRKSMFKSNYLNKYC